MAFSFSLDTVGDRIVSLLVRILSPLGHLLLLPSSQQVRSRNVGANIGAAFKALAGGELKALTSNIETSRTVAIDRMVRMFSEQHLVNIICLDF